MVYKQFKQPRLEFIAINSHLRCQRFNVLLQSSSALFQNYQKKPKKKNQKTETKHGEKIQLKVYLYKMGDYVLTLKKMQIQHNQYVLLSLTYFDCIK